MTTYNHAYIIAFEVPGSTDENGGDVTHERLMECLQKRISDLVESAKHPQGENLLDACDAPYTTFEEAD